MAVVPARANKSPSISKVTTTANAIMGASRIRPATTAEGAGRTRREAEEKYREYHKHASIEGALAHFASSTGIDLSR
jgi:hypothetical protein